MTYQELSIQVAIDGGGTERFDARAGDDPGEAGYDLVTIVDGPFAGAPTHAVFARWRVDDEAQTAAFEASRRELFELRREHIATFGYDALLRRRGSHRSEYVVIGLYGDDDGRAAARSHPAIAEWARAHPASELSAVDISGMQLGRVIRATRW